MMEMRELVTYHMLVISIRAYNFSKTRGIVNKDI